ncbi:ribosome maturation factor RimM [Sphingomonas aracearum]|uniref:Ribosome maturation factor RimM n=1 Tax=Sphingomonas aracearum TaxID=2283317 RepID=A0A369VYR6_9SPHN|nr:ribosome maturation factor RimM [Sphingomonas aracearum]RDE06270.1 16S rRNA processing protein RimM [Sphingomonas aracearum]
MSRKTPPTKASPRRSRPKAPTTPPQAATGRPTPDAADDRQIVLAVVIGAHGIGGEVRLKVFAEDFSAFGAFNNGALTLSSLREGSNGAIARFAEVRDRNAAEALRGTELTVARDALPGLEDGEYYHADLIGLPVVLTTGEAIGRVVLVENFGAGDVLEIERDAGGRFMVPMRPEAVPEWSAERLVVEPAFAE